LQIDLLLAADAIAAATAEAEAMGLLNSRIVVLDVNRLPSEPKLDLITAFDSIHDRSTPPRPEQSPVRAGQGRPFLMIDFNSPASSRRMSTTRSPRSITASARCTA
jgi:hypothetical protein